MTNFNKRCAFTLSELLLSLIIVGVIAVITIPVLVNNFQKKYFATQLRNFVAQIEQLAKNEMITYRTRDLFSTDFGDPDKLLTEKHFGTILKTCTKSKATNDCWNGKGFYRNLNGGLDNYSKAYRTIILKNGMTVGYMIGTGGSFTPKFTVATFIIDLNGNDKPNTWGRDYFSFQINSKGRVLGRTEAQYGDQNYFTYAKKVSKCKGNAASFCIDAIMAKNWKMDY